MKILMLSPDQRNRYNWTHALFRQSFSNFHDVTYYGDGYEGYIPNKPIPEVIKNKNFDLILTYGLKYTEPFLGIGEITNIPKVHIAVDYFADSTSGTYERNHKMFNRDRYNLYFGTCGHVVRNLIKNGVCSTAFVLPFSIDINLYKNLNLNKIYDVFTVFSINQNVYPYRKMIQKMVSTLGVKQFLKSVNQKPYIQAINQSKICITSNNKFKSLSIKYTEFLSCGSFMLADKPEDFEEFGYVDKKHLILYDDLNDLKNKINYYLKHDSEREEIAKNGMEFVRKNHNNTIRIQQFTNIITQELGIK
jgi:hypothetical protein